MNDFYITITNKDIDKTFDNEVANWQSILPNKLSTKNYEVGIAQISYPFSWFNIFEDQIILLEFRENKIHNKSSHKISKGFYTIEQLLNIINTNLNKFCSENGIKEVGKIYVQNYGGIEKIHIDFPTDKNKFIYIEFSELLNDILGAKKQSLSKFAIDIIHGESNYSYVCPHSYDITVGYHSIFVYSDIIEPIIVGDKLVPLMKIIEIPSHMKYNQQIMVKYANIEYRMVNKTEIKAIEIQFADDSGENIRFNGSSQIVIVLHFKEINKSN